MTKRIKINLELLKCNRFDKEFQVSFVHKYGNKNVNIRRVIRDLENKKDTSERLRYIFSVFKLSGKCRNWNDNKTIQYEHSYKHGVKHGVCKYYSYSGELICRRTYNYGNFEISYKDLLKNKFRREYVSLFYIHYKNMKVDIRNVITKFTSNRYKENQDICNFVYELQKKFYLNSSAIYDNDQFYIGVYI